MTSAQYNRWTAPLRGRPGAVRALRGLNRALTLVGYVAYPLLLLLVGIQALGGRAGGWLFFCKELLIPAGTFAVMSAVRARISAPRPYEVLDIEPLIQKSTQGHSFPSRHVFSAFVISMAWLAWCAPVGIALLVVSTVIAMVRVLGGVHWPRDVIVGGLLGIAAGLLLFC